MSPNGTLLTAGGRPDKAGRPKAIPIAVRRAVTYWSKALLSERSAAQLTRALAVLGAHPDAYSPGYSSAKAARERVQAEVTART